MAELLLKRLLNQVSAIARTQKKLALLSGENFNVFRILKLESREVRTHSAFLGELLNPAGSHGMQDTFLRLFIEQIDFPAFDSKNAKLVVEKYIGQIDAGYTQGGRIDLYLESKGEHLFIENKIYAIDQPNQLERYHQHNPNARLLYLTLEGGGYSLPQGSQLTAAHYQCFSYKEDITKWLDRCHQVAAAHPIVRETIRQYTHLINHLTGQTPDNFMKEETKQLLLGDYATLESAWYCKQIVEELKQDTLRAFWSELEGRWPEEPYKPVGTLGAYPIVLGRDQDDDKSDLYYFFSIESPIPGQSVPSEVTREFIALATGGGGLLPGNDGRMAWGSFDSVRNPQAWDRQEQFDMADTTKRAAVIQSMIDQAARDGAALARRMELTPSNTVQQPA